MYQYSVNDSMFSYYVIPTEEWTKQIIKNGQAKNPLLINEVVEIVQCYRAYGLITMLNSDIMIAQAIVETGWFTSSLWVERRNPAGLGITQSGVQGLNYLTIRRGIQTHVAHVCAYFYAKENCPSCELSWPDVRHWFHDDLEKIADFTSGLHKWATAPNYPEKIVQVANNVIKESM